MNRDEQLIRAALEMAANVLDGYDEYDRQLCCDGRMCGCQGSTVHQMMQHFIRAIDPAGVLAKVGAADTGEWNAVKTVHMTYRNYRGEVSQREIVPVRLWFGTTEWHPEPGWLLTAHDLGKGVDRDFALADCEFAGLTVTPQPAPDTVAGEKGGE